MSNATQSLTWLPKAKQPLVFLHVPKTAGTTLWLILRRQYSPQDVLRVDGHAAFSAVTEQQWRETRVLTGHLAYGAHRFRQPPTYVTVLRDPLERTLSHYCHLIRDADAFLTLDDFLAAGVQDADNGQTRMLAGPAAEAVPFGQCDRDVFEQAKRNLTENIAMTGLTERFDETLMLFQRRFGWNMPCYVRENVGANRIERGDVPRHLLRRIWELTHWDRELYALASARLEEQIAREGASFAPSLRHFRIANLRYRRLRALFAASPLHLLKSRLAMDRQMGLERAVRTALSASQRHWGQQVERVRQSNY